MTGRLVALRGRNFSGRSERLRAEEGPYVGPEISTFLSGIASTVREEVALSALEPDEVRLAQFGLEDIAPRNPFTLSGGEQALVAAAAVAFSGAPAASLDCCLEQLDDLRCRTAIVNLRAHVPRLMIADNDLDHLGSDFSEVIEMKGPGASTFSAQINGLSSTVPKRGTGVRLKLDRLGFAYEAGALLFRDLQGELTPGLITLLEGPNGAGKSTLAKLLTGILKPASGGIRMDGHPFCAWRRPGVLMAYHHQDPDVQLFSETVQQELQVACGVANDAAWTVEAFGLSSVLHLHPLELPFVLRKRVALAATLARPCAWYILDEPTLGQDLENCRQLAQIFSRLAEGGAGVCVISHSKRFHALFPRARRMKLESGHLIELS